VESVDILDSICSSVRIDVVGNTILRIIPRLDEMVNEE
jgi:NADH-quinone oxidoreductase subunit G